MFNFFASEATTHPFTLPLTKQHIELHHANQPLTLFKIQTQARNKSCFCFHYQDPFFFFLFFSSLTIFLFYLEGCLGSFVKIIFKRSQKEEELR